MPTNPRYKKNIIKLPAHAIAVYASPKISAALDLINDMSLYQGVKIIQLLSVVYEQGKKDGAKKAIEDIENSIKQTIKLIPHRNPGKPRRRP